MMRTLALAGLGSVPGAIATGSIDRKRLGLP